MKNSNKPTGTLSNEDLISVMASLDEKIKAASEESEKHDKYSPSYSMYVAKELAYLEIRNLILSKI